MSLRPVTSRRLAGVALALFALATGSSSRAADGAPAAAQATSIELALVDLRGKRKRLGIVPASVFAPRVSPDGKRVVFELQDSATDGAPATMRLHVADLAHVDQHLPLPLQGTARNWAAVWMPDGERLIFQSSGDGPDTLWIRRADGTGDAEKLIEARAPEGVYDGGRQLAFITLTGNRDYGISMLDLGTRAVTRLVDVPGSEQHSSRLSPDGRWIAYASNETGRQELWLEPVPTTGKRYRLTDDGGSHPLWSPDGKTLYFDAGGQLYRIDVFLGAEAPKVGESHELPIRGFRQGDLRRQFDLMPDGKAFLMQFPVAP